MSKLRNISLDLSKIQEAIQNNHSSIRTANNGKKYLSIQVWDSDEPDQYQNDCSVKLNSTKEARESGEQQVYIGNGKKGGAK
jgi:apolipoprotein N-acyltransferase